MREGTGQPAGGGGVREMSKLEFEHIAETVRKAISAELQLTIDEQCGRLPTNKHVFAMLAAESGAATAVGSHLAAVKKAIPTMDAETYLDGLQLQMESAFRQAAKMAAQR